MDEAKPLEESIAVCSECSFGLVGKSQQIQSRISDHMVEAPHKIYFVYLNSNKKSAEVGYVEPDPEKVLEWGRMTKRVANTPNGRLHDMFKTLFEVETGEEPEGFAKDDIYIPSTFDKLFGLSQVGG